MEMSVLDKNCFERLTNRTGQNSLSFQSLTIVVNGKTVNTQIQKRSGEAGNLSLSNIELASNNQFQAFITHFNVWSRALSLDEALSYSSGSDIQSRPDIFDWNKNLKEVMLNEKCAEWRSFDAEMVSKNNVEGTQAKI